MLPFPIATGTPDFWSEHSPLPYTALERPLLAAVVAENSAWFEELRKAAEQPWQVSFNESNVKNPIGNAGLPQNYVSPMVSRLGHRIQLHVGEGRYGEAFADIDTLRAFAARQPQHPEPMIGVTAMQVETTACVHAALAILHCKAIHPDLEVWVDCLPQAASLNQVKTYFATVIRIQALDRIQSRHRSGPYKVQFDSLSNFADTAWKRWYYQAPDWNELLRRRNELIDTICQNLFSQASWPTQESAFQTLDDAIPDTKRPAGPDAWQQQGFANPTDFVHAHSTRWVLYGGRNMIIASHRLTAAYRFVRLTLALKRWQIHHGTWPKSLQQLVDSRLTTAETITDPFSEKSFQYRLTRNGGELYCLGPNRQDDSGLTYYRQIPVQFRTGANRDVRTGRYPDDSPSISWIH